MKRIILILSCFIICFCSGCTAQSSGKYIVSAIGISRNGKELNVLVEAVTVNFEDADRDIQNIIFKGSAKNVGEAFLTAYNKSARPLSLEHCAVIILDDTLSKEDIRKTFIFCENRAEIPRAVAFVRTKSSEELLKAKPYSSVAVGFDIVSVLATQFEKKQVEFKNRYYEIFETVLQADRFKALPEFAVSEEKIYLMGDDKNKRKK